MKAYNVSNKKASEQLQINLICMKENTQKRCAANNEVYVQEKTPKKRTGFSNIGPKELYVPLVS